MEQFSIQTLAELGSSGLAILLTILFYKSTIDRSKENKETKIILVDIIERNTTAHERSIATQEKLSLAVSSLERTINKGCN